MSDKIKIDYSELDFEGFRRLALREDISANEKIGFPDEYRNGMSDFILQDILSKCSLLSTREKRVLDIGPGCGELAHRLIQFCVDQGHHLALIDSKEMLSFLPDDSSVFKYPGSFPEILAEEIFRKYEESFDVILVYSVIQYPYKSGNFVQFFDECLALLRPGGQLLLGDIPNVSMRKRFLGSASGSLFHRSFFGTDKDPEVIFNNLEKGQMDDSAVAWLVSRARLQGFHAWSLPQSCELPMSNRREDILIVRP